MCSVSPPLPPPAPAAAALGTTAPAALPGARRPNTGPPPTTPNCSFGWENKQVKQNEGKRARRRREPGFGQGWQHSPAYLPAAAGEGSGRRRQLPGHHLGGGWG